MSKKRSDIEDEALGRDGENGGKMLTADLPARTFRRKKRRIKRIAPWLIIFIAALVGFLIPILQNDGGLSNKSVTLGGEPTGGDDYRIPINIEEQPITKYEEKEYAVVKTNEVGYLNVRSEPSTAGAKLGTLDIGDKVEVADKQEKWVKVKLEKPLSGKTEGWVSAEYVDVVVENVEVE